MEEWERLWTALQASSDTRLYALTVCALASGAREGELMGMERANLRLDPVEIDPFTGEARTGGPRCKVTDTKSGEARTLYFPGLAGELLRELSQVPRLSRYVWTAPEEDPRPPIMVRRYSAGTLPWSPTPPGPMLCLS